MQVGAGPTAGEVVVVKLQVCVFTIHGVESVEVESAEVRTVGVGAVEEEHIE